MICWNQASTSSSFPAPFNYKSSDVDFETTPCTNALSVNNEFSSPGQFNCSSGSSIKCWWLNECFIRGRKTFMLGPQFNLSQEEEPFAKRLF